MILEKTQKGLGNPLQQLAGEALSKLAQFEMRKREEKGKLGLFDWRRWRTKRANPEEIPADLMMVAGLVLAIMFLSASVPHAGINTAERVLAKTEPKPMVPSTQRAIKNIFKGSTVEAQLIEEQWHLSKKAPDHVKNWEHYIDSIVETYYPLRSSTFEQFGLTKNQMKNIMSAFVGYENGGLTPSITQDYGPLQININNFGVGEDPSNLMLQGEKAQMVFADGLLRTGSIEGAMGYYNGGNIGPHPDYVPCVRALYELLSNPDRFEQYHVVTSGETLSYIAERYGVTYDRIKQFRYNEFTKAFELVPLENPSFIRTGMVLIIQ
jgi:hypothetical protein